MWATLLQPIWVEQIIYMLTPSEYHEIDWYNFYCKRFSIFWVHRRRTEKCQFIKYTYKLYYLRKYNNATTQKTYWRKCIVFRAGINLVSQLCPYSRLWLFWLYFYPKRFSKTIYESVYDDLQVHGVIALQIINNYWDFISLDKTFVNHI